MTDANVMGRMLARLHTPVAGLADEAPQGEGARVLELKPTRTEGPVQAEVVTEQDVINAVYDRLEIDYLLEAYAQDETGRLARGQDVEQALVSYAGLVASQSMRRGAIDIFIVRLAFDRMYDGMERAARLKYGPEKPRGMADALLQKLGLRPPHYRQYFSRLDDRYWQQQFMEEYEHQTWTKKRVPQETEQAYLARYIAVTLHHFPWATFSYI
jgi:hypothetical protein